MEDPYYDFVPFAELKREKIPKSSLHSQVDSNSLSGIVECSLVVQNYLCIKSFYSNNPEEVFIPASSLRGMIRTIMEVLYAGCGFKIEREYHYKKENKHVTNCLFPDDKFATLEYNENDDLLSSYADCSKRIDEEYKKIPEHARKNKTIKDFQICPVCSLFGITAGSSISLSSRLSFEDSSKVSVTLEKISLPRSEQPKVYSQSRYFIDKKYKGRKFYLTPPDHQIVRGDHQDVYTVPANTPFTFKIGFSNLSEYELGMLLFALKLDDQLCHKLGYGKNYGMGIVKINPIGIKLIDSQSYKTFNSQLQEDKLSIPKRISDFKGKYHKKFVKTITQTDQFKKLQEILSFNMPGQEEEIKEYTVSKFEKNTAYIEDSGEEIKVAGFIPDVKVGDVLSGFIKIKKDGKREFILKKEKNDG